MNGGGRRQLPSWMLRPCTADQTGILEIKQGSNENNSEELGTIAAQTQKKVKRKKHESGVPLVEKKSNLLKKGEGRTRDRNSSQQKEDKYENEPYLLKECGTRKGKRPYKRGKDQGFDLPHGKMETDDGPKRKKYCGNTSGKKRTNKPMEDSHDGTILSEDELTVEDLLSIAEEYVNADKETKNLQFNSETRSSVAVIGSEKDPTAHKEDRESHTYKPLSAKSISNNALSGEGSIIYPMHTGDPARDMLDLLLGSLLKKSEEVERKNNVITKNIVLDHELSKRSQIDTAAEVVPVMRKKVSFKDRVAMLLD